MPTMSAASVNRWILLLTLGVGACQRPAETSAVPQEASAVPAPAVPASVAAEPFAEPTHPLELVPARARLMLMARSPQRVAQVWERDRLSGLYPDDYERMSSDLKRMLGVDALDPRQLDAVGIDATAPVGVAVLSFENEALMFFGASPDPVRLVQALEGSLGRPLPAETIGTAQVVRLEQKLWLVTRHGMFGFVLVDRPRQGSPDYAAEVARLDANDSCAHAGPMASAHTNLPREADLHGMLDLAGIIRDAMQRQRTRAQQRVAAASRELVEARQRGANAEELSHLRDIIRDSERAAASRRREQQIGEQLFERTVGQLEGIGLVLNADERGLHGRMHLALSPNALLRELLVPSPSAPAALLALSDEPLLVSSARVDVGVALDLLTQTAAAAGGSYSEIDAELVDELGVHFDRDVRPLLDGRMTLAVTNRDPPPGVWLDDLGDTIGGVWATGVNDPVAARSVLDAWVATWPGHAWTPVPDVDGYSLDLEPGRTIWLGVVADQFVATTDLATIRRMRDGVTGPVASTVPSPQAWQTLTGGSGAARLALGQRLPMFTLFSMAAAFDSVSFGRSIDDTLEQEFPGHDVASLPASAKVRRRNDTFEKRRGEREDLDRQIGRRRLQQAWERARALGTTALVVRPVTTGFVVDGGHYAPGGVAAYVETLLQLARWQQARTELDPQLQRAEAAEDEARRRAEDARRRQIQRWIDGSKRSEP